MKAEKSTSNPSIFDNIDIPKNKGKERTDMKILLKILFAPIMALMWIAIKAGVVFTYISGLVLGIVSGIIALISIVYLLTGGITNGLIGLVIAYLVSPYGIPTFAVMILGVVQKIRLGLQDCIYR